MSYAVTHLFVPMFLLELYRDLIVKSKEKFPFHYVLLGGIAGVLPDFDIAIFYVLSFFNFEIDSIHRTFSHNIFVPLFFIVLGFLFYNYKNEFLGRRHLKLKTIFFVIAFGTFIHLLLDMIVAGSIMPFYPILDYSIGFNLIRIFPLSWKETILQSIDAAVLILWFIYIEVKHKITEIF